MLVDPNQEKIFTFFNKKEATFDFFLPSSFALFLIHCKPPSLGLSRMDKPAKPNVSSCPHFLGQPTYLVNTGPEGLIQQNLCLYC